MTDRGEAQPGGLVRVVSGRGRDFGVAHYSSTSQIALRLLSTSLPAFDEGFLAKRIAAAIAFRQQVVTNSEAYRLIYSEADQLPGLIVDRYGDHLVLQSLTQGMDAMQNQIVEELVKQLQPASVVARNDVAVRDKEGLPKYKQVVHGELPGPVEVDCHGVVFAANLLEGQKTGIYLDQRENYLAAARWAKGTALDCFTSTGGFALHMAKAGVTVEGIDSGEAALAAAEANRLRNGLTNIRFREADVFSLLQAYRSGGKRFDTIVLDPPAFTKTKANLDGALRGYKEINLKALQLLAPGGILVTCSCSHHVSEALLLGAVAAAAADARRPLRLLERRQQAADHPVLLGVPESLYLKCLVLQAV